MLLYVVLVFDIFLCAPCERVSVSRTDMRRGVSIFFDILDMHATVQEERAERGSWQYLGILARAMNRVSASLSSAEKTLRSHRRT